MSNESSEPQAVPGGEPIAAVSRILQVPMPTLRSWELRYGIPELARSSRRHRRYTSDDIHALRLMRDEITGGRRAAAAARSVRALLGVSGPAADFISAVLAASGRSDTAGIRAELSRAADALGNARCIDDVLLPAMRQVGQWWESGRCGVPQEHLTSAAVRAWLSERISLAPVPTNQRVVVLACGPSDFHTIGCECLALLLRHQGWRTRVLGAGTSTEKLAAAIASTGPAAAVVVSHLPTARRRAVESISAVHAQNVATFYAGNAFTALKNRKSVPGTYLGDRIVDACALICDALTGSSPVEARVVDRGY